MEKYNLIVQNELFIDILKKLEIAERDRTFCKHGLCHLLDVARIAYIMVLEGELSYSKDVVYAAGLLHDIGRLSQYETGRKHDTEGLLIAPGILKSCGYTDEEILVVCDAIGRHRELQEELNLNYVIYKADKLSRNCFNCVASPECNWAENKKNKGVV